MPNDDIIDSGKCRNPAKHRDIPIHGLGRDRFCGGEEAKDEEGNQEDEGDDVDGHAPAPERELGWW